MKVFRFEALFLFTACHSCVRGNRWLELRAEASSRLQRAASSALLLLLPFRVCVCVRVCVVYVSFWINIRAGSVRAFCQDVFADFSINLRFRINLEVLHGGLGMEPTTLRSVGQPPRKIAQTKTRSRFS